MNAYALSLRWLAVVAMLLIAAALAACGGEAPVEDTATSGGATATPNPTYTPEPTASPTSTASPLGLEDLPRLTLEQYGAWCSKFEEMPEPATYGEAVKLMDMIQDEGESVSPPEALEEYHQTWLGGNKIVRSVFSRYPEDDSLDSSVLFGDSEFLAHVADLEDIESRLPSEVHVHVSGCF